MLSAASARSASAHSYEREGFLILRGFFSAEAVQDALREAEDLRLHSGLADPLNLRCRYMPHAETGEPLFEVFDPISDISPACARMAYDSQLASVMADLYGEPCCLFKDKLIYKPPGARGYQIHQDWIAWKGFPKTFSTVLIALDPSTTANGCTQVFPGFHAECLSPADGVYHPLDRELFGPVEPVPLELDPGDIAIFTGFTPHFSDPNRSSEPRRQLFLSYNARSDGGDQRAAHYAEFQARQRASRAKQGGGHVYFR